MQAPPPPIVTWPGLTPYGDVVARMEELVAERRETVILCEHEAVLTVGTSGDRADVGAAVDIPVVDTGRGGKVTYHGPGQRVVYLVVDLNRWGKDVRAYVKWLQAWLIASLKELDVNSYITDDIGVWVDGASGPRKVAAIGVRVRKGFAFHGISLNVANDLGIYTRFVPCGLAGKGVTSLQALGFGGGMAEVDAVLQDKLLEMLPSL